MANFYAWIAKDRRTNRAPGGSCSTAQDARPVVPLWKCTAEGGPANCRYHGRFLKGSGQMRNPSVTSVKGSGRRRDADDIDMSADATDPYAGIHAVIEDIVNGAMDTANGRDFYDATMLADLSRVSKAVAVGSLSPSRMPGNSMRSRTIDGIPGWALDAYHLLAEGNGDYESMDDTDETIRNNAFEDGQIRAFAKAAGVWIEDDVNKTVIREIRPEIKALGGGQESIVYDAGDTAVKVMSLPDYRKSPRRAIESLALFNFYFPESAQEIIGIGQNRERKTCLVLGQRRLSFSSKNVTEAEKRAFMAERGFVPVAPKEKDASSYVSGDGMILIHDIHKGNIKRTTSGELVVIDAYPELATPAVGGSYNPYRPPKRIFTNQKINRIRKEWKSEMRKNPIKAEDEAYVVRPRLVAVHPTNPLPNNPYYDPERIARIEAGRENTPEEREEIARHDRIAGDPRKRFIRGMCVADIGASGSRASAEWTAKGDPTKEELAAMWREVMAKRRARDT